MASKSAYQSTEKGAEIEEQLDSLEALLERLRASYEQYFLGISKVPPSHLHLDAERRVRDLSQEQIKNTALRYRHATLSQRFGAYNTYWKRTLRMIEQGKYVRDLQRVQRKSVRSGEEIPEEILAAMPKLMRQRVERDRANVMAVAARQGRVAVAADEARPAGPKNVHRLDDALATDDLDIDGMFASLTREAEEAIDAAPIIPARAPTPPPEAEAAPPPSSSPEASRKRSGPTTPPLRPPSAMRGGPPPMPPPRPGAPRPQTVVAPPPPPARPPVPPPPAGGPRPSAPAATRPGAPARRPEVLAPPPGMDDASTRALYQRYLKARELCGENNDGVTYDKLVRTLRSQSSRIMTDTRASGVEFGVVIKDNKVILKAKPKL